MFIDSLVLIVQDVFSKSYVVDQKGAKIDDLFGLPQSTAISII